MAKAKNTSAYDLTTLTMREIALIEKLSKQSFASLGSVGAPIGDTLAAIAYTFRRRENSAYTWNDAQDLTLQEISEITSALDGLNVSDGIEDDGIDAVLGPEDPAEAA